MDAKQQKMSDRAFDHELNLLVGRAISSGVNPAVVIGCLQMSVIDAYNWKLRNDAALAKLSQDMKGTQVHLVDPDEPNGKIVGILQSGIAPAAKASSDKDGTLVQAE